MSVIDELNKIKKQLLDLGIVNENMKNCLHYLEQVKVEILSDEIDRAIMVDDITTIKKLYDEMFK